MPKKIAIIGGGISGLTAGIYALRAGFDVEIYESHHVAGGMCAQWQRKGFLCTSAIHWMMGTQDGSDLNEIWKTVGAIDHTTEIHSIDYLSAYKNGNTYGYLYGNVNKLEAEFLLLSPQDEDAIKELIRDIKIFQKLPIPASKPMDLMEPMEKVISFAPYIKAEKKTLLSSISVGEYVKRFRSPVIRHLLQSIVPDVRLNADILMIWLSTCSNGDIGIPHDGFFSMAKRMEQKFLSLGGKMHLNSVAEKITVINGAATGIVLANGKEVNTDYIIPTVSPDVLLGKLLSNQVKDGYFERRFATPDNFFTPALTLINLNVNVDVSNFPYTLDVVPHQPVFIYNTEVKNIKINHYAFVPYFCKEGKTLMQVVLQEQEFECWKKLKTTSESEYRQAKENIAKLAVQEVETVYPATRGNIELLDVATPLTLHRYCHSYNGAYLAFCAMSGGQRENHKGKICGIENMYLAGQWVFLDGGLPMAAVAGKFAVQRICNQENMDYNITK